MSLPDKERVREAVLAKLGRTLDLLLATAEKTRVEATHEEAKPENDKDTRALEQSYLARGQAMRAEQLIEAREQLRFMTLPAFGPDDPIVAGALVALECDDTRRCVLLIPFAGGTEVEVDGQPIVVVTPASPLGRALTERCVGEEVDLPVRGVKKTYEITAAR
jgi:transcription elongation GreA/GreB family factor